MGHAGAGAGAGAQGAAAEAAEAAAPRRGAIWLAGAGAVRAEGAPLAGTAEAGTGLRLKWSNSFSRLRSIEQGRGGGSHGKSAAS